MIVDPTDTNTININPIEFDAPIENNKNEQFLPNITKDTHSSYSNDMGDYFDVFSAGIIGGISFGLFEAYRRKHCHSIIPLPPSSAARTLNTSINANSSFPTRSADIKRASLSPLEGKRKDEYEKKIKKMIGLLYGDYWKPRIALEIKRQGDELRAEGNPFLFLKVLCQDDTMRIQMKTILGNGWGNMARRPPFVSNLKSEIKQITDPNSYINLLSEASDKPVEILRIFFENNNWEGLLDYLFLT